MNNKTVTDLSELGQFKDQFEDIPAKIQGNDAEISGGRYIKNVKSNQLFTGQFEKSDLDNFLSVWRQFKENSRFPIIPALMQHAEEMIRNYKGQVCPIEVMLYSSNIIAYLFTNNRKLMENVADVVCDIVRNREFFIRSIRHILEVWKWDQAINICEIAVGKLAANRNFDEDVQLLQYIYDNFHYQENVNYGCFYALILSKKEEVVVDILDMVRDLKENDWVDQQIGGLFKKFFPQNFHDHLSRLDVDMFWDTSPYVQDLIRKLLLPDTQKNIIESYKNATSKEERRQIVERALDRIIKNKIHISMYDISIYDAINVLKLANSESISEQLFLNLEINSKKSHQYSSRIAVAIIYNYFGSIKYPRAIQAFLDIKPNYEYYAAVRLALFSQNKISSDDIIENCLSEEKPDQVKIYVEGFWGLTERNKELRISILNYLSQNLSEEKLSTAITNFYRLIQKYQRRFYEPQVGKLIETWFGYKTILEAALPLKLQDQMACLNIIDTIIDNFNFKSYESFLYYVAEENFDFPPTVANLAKKILTKLRIGKPRE